MTGPRPSGAQMLVTGKHGRTVMGIALMTISVATVLLGNILHIKPITSCVSSWVEVVHEWGFPVLLFVAGFRLFDIESFNDLVAAGKALIPGKKNGV